MRVLRVLVACEESQAVTKEFRELGHEAYSCDILPCSGGHPEWHVQQDVTELLNQEWDLIIAFPPCDHLSKAGAAHWKKPHKQVLQQEALRFVKSIMDLTTKHICIENPVGKINTAIRKPDQKVHPYHFGHPYTKETCFWLKNLPVLSYTEVVDPVANWVKPGNIRNRRFGDVKEGHRVKSTLDLKHSQASLALWLNNGVSTS